MRKKKTVELKSPEIIPLVKEPTSNEGTNSSIPEVSSTLHVKTDSSSKEINETQSTSNSAPVQDSVPPWEDIPPELEEDYQPSSSRSTNLVDVDEAFTANKHPTTEEVIKITAEIKDNTVEKNSSQSISIEDLLLADDIVEDIDLIDGSQEDELLDGNKAVEAEVTDADIVKKPSPQVDPNQPWYAVIPKLKLSGRANELIKHCLLESHENGIISLILSKDSEDLFADTVEQEIQAAMINFYGNDVRLNLRIAEVALTKDSNAGKQNETPAQRNDRKILETQQHAEHNIKADPFVIELQSRFGAQIVPGSVKAKQILD